MHHVIVSCMPVRSCLRALFICAAIATQSPASSQNYSFETFYVTGAWHTVARAINNHGQIVGILQGSPPTPIGFLRDTNGITSIWVPGAGPLNGTVASGINDNGTIVGSYVTEDGAVISHGFILQNGILTTFDVPDSQFTRAGQINNSGTIVGSWSAAGPGDRIGRGFLKSGNTFTYLDFPGIPETQTVGGTSLVGINDAGDIIGSVNTNGFRSFLYRSNSFTFIESPVGIDTTAHAINNHGQIVGSYRDVNGRHGFITISNRFYRVDVPGVEPGPFGPDTAVYSINDHGQIVGSVFRGGFEPPVQLGFVATPCDGSSTNCITLPEIVRPPPPPLRINCPTDWVVPCNGASQPEESLQFVVTAAYDGGPPVTVTCDPPPGSRFPFGTTVVRCTARDDRGYETNCQFTITRVKYEFEGVLPPLRRRDGSGGSFASPVRSVLWRKPLPVRFTTSCMPSEARIRLTATQYFGPGRPWEDYYCVGTDGSDEFKLVDGVWQMMVDLRRSGIGPGIWRLSFVTPDGEHAVWIRVRRAPEHVTPRFDPGDAYWPAMPPR